MIVSVLLVRSARKKDRTNGTPKETIGDTVSRRDIVKRRETEAIGLIGFVRAMRDVIKKEKGRINKTSKRKSCDLLLNTNIKTLMRKSFQNGCKSANLFHLAT